MSALIRLYPRRWRERYGHELDDLIASRPASLADRIDLVRGAADAWLHPELVAGDEPLVRADRPVRARPALAAVASMLGGAMAIAGSLILNAAPAGPWGYREEPLGTALIVAAIAVTGIAAAAVARPAQARAGRAMAALGGLCLFGWPLVLIGIWGYVVAGLAYARAERDPLARPVLVAGVVVLPLINTEDARILLVVPFGLAWLVIGLLGLRTASLVGAAE